ncbi:HelD family protein [Luteipulveratus flavus]|uniref:AAA family ATPase n=1 Tax=Luteipulveratus flavus TaxID=3031728 RepID=A0ABT6CAU0_9MICO|nr:UvrD-helicase domain-containing protein [Luteipulveratus sp. YIM 133296]MDF8265648.1 AAA family ATPase [Luteipulveratus sp. YIM 133296]
MTAQRTDGPAVPPEVAAEVAFEQAHVDRVYAELAKAGARVSLVEAEGLARGRTDRTGVARDEEITGLFERDALMFSAGRRRASLEQQYEGLVFGRLDLEHGSDDRADREIRYIGRIGVRDDEYEPLVIDWRAPAASAFYQATPVEPMGVLRRRVLRCRDAVVLGVEDDLMVPEAPEDMVIVGDGALMAALTRTRGAQMRDIVATIQRHQDEAIRASARGITEITGGPGTGKTVVALHRAAYLLYSDRRRYEAGGILVVGPSAAYTAYIERVLPSLGEDTVTLRSLGDVVDGTTAVRLDSPDAARVKGSLTIRQVLSRAARDVAPDAASRLRTMVAGHPVRIDRQQLQQIRRRVLRNHQHNLGHDAVVDALAEAAWQQVRPHAATLEKAEFVDRFEDHLEVEAFVRDWWRPIDAREVLLWLADADRAARYAQGVLPDADVRVLQESMAEALQTGQWSVADIAMIDDVAARLGPVQEREREERGFYQIEELDGLGVSELEVTGSRQQSAEVAYERNPADVRERLLYGRIGKPEEYAHVLVDEAQDLSPMQWRMVGRRGRYASWTVVGDAAQSSWPVESEAATAREEAFGSKQRQRFHMTTNYRNAREIFDYAAEVIRREVPDADIPDAVRETGVHPVVSTVSATNVADAAMDATKGLLDEVEGAVAVVAPARWRERLGHVPDLAPGRVLLIDPMSTKGLEYDATVVVDPAEITRESPGGIRVLYVVLTRAAHRMTVLEVAP